MRRIFRNLVSIEEAKQRLEESLEIERRIEEVPLRDSYGRIVAEDVYAPIDIPPFDRAAMDGYAVRAEDTFGAEEDKPVRLKVVGRVEAGDRPKVEVKRGEAVEISTGAAMPKGSNAVVMVEYTSAESGDVLVFRAVAPGENVIAAGSDIMAGELLVRRDTRLTAREIGMLSAVGIRNVKVYSKPVVAVISTGNELIDGGELEYGKIYDINSAMLCAVIEENGGRAAYLGIARDNEEEIRKKIEEGLKTADIVLTSGGTSAGIGDMIYRILGEVGEVIVHGVAVKPGKPTVIAIAKNKPVFGLPGYPTSAFMIFEIFVAPLIRRMSGVSRDDSRLKAKLSSRVFSALGRREFLPVNVVKGESYTAYPVTGNYSAAVSKLGEADGFIEIPESRAFVEEGEEVEVKLFSTLKPADIIIIGSHCVGIDVLLELMRKDGPFTSKVINAGSSGGLAAIRRGEADIAGVHLLDAETGEYNIPYIKRYGLRDVVLVKGYMREQGFIVAKNNPKKIKGFEDLLRDDVTIVNRNQGSGTRILLDMHLSKIAERKGVELDELTREIDGYTIEAKSHTAVAVAVLMGKADAGLGIRSVAERYGLDFIPVRGEEYDFLIRKERFEKDVVRLFLDTLKSEEFKRELEKRLPGISVYDRTGEIIEF